MLKIGDFSKLSRVSVRILHRRPGCAAQPHLALHDLGLSLAQIGQLLRDELPIEQLGGMLRFKQAELAQQLQAEQERLARVAARLRQLEQEVPAAKGRRWAQSLALLALIWWRAVRLSPWNTRV